MLETCAVDEDEKKMGRRKDRKRFVTEGGGGLWVKKERRKETYAILPTKRRKTGGVESGAER